MDLLEYFEFLSADDIRIKGHRIGIDDVLYLYQEGYSPEEIGAQFPSLSQEQIYATITYYLRNRAQINAYLNRLDTWREQRYQEWAAQPSPLIERLRELKGRQVEGRLAA